MVFGVNASFVKREINSAIHEKKHSPEFTSKDQLRAVKAYNDATR